MQASSLQIDLWIVSFYLAFLVLFGLYCSRNTKSLQDFSVTGKQYSTFVIVATFSASFIGGGFSTGNATQVYLYGIGNTLALFGFSVGQMLLGRYIAPRMAKFQKVLSVGGIMRQAYGKGAQAICGVLSALLCAGVLGTQIIAIGYMFHVFLGVQPLYGILIAFGIVLIYSTLGGMQAIIMTDTLQFCILSVGVPLLLVFAVQGCGGMDAMLSAVPQSHFNPFLKGGVVPFVSLFFTLMLGEMLVPPYVQRLLISKDVQKTARATTISGIFSIPFFIITGAIGLCAVAKGSISDANLVMPALVQSVLPVGLRGVVVAAMLSIYMSTADSFLNSASVGLVADGILPLLSREPGQKAKLRMVKCSNIVIGLCAMGIALCIPNVFDSMMFAYNFWCPMMLVPLLGALLCKKPRKKAFYAAFFAGAAGVLIWKLGWKSPFGIDGMLVGFLFSLIAYRMTFRKN